MMYCLSHLFLAVLIVEGNLLLLLPLGFGHCWVDSGHFPLFDLSEMYEIRLEQREYPVPDSGTGVLEV